MLILNILACFLYKYNEWNIVFPKFFKCPPRGHLYKLTLSMNITLTTCEGLYHQIHNNNVGDILCLVLAKFCTFKSRIGTKNEAYVCICKYIQYYFIIVEVLVCSMSRF